jgi:glycosyltransferase involved in cell wall biosynthesis
LKPKIKIAFASGTDDLNARLIARMREVFPELPLYVVSEFPPADSDLHWVRYRGGLIENLARCRSAFRGKSIRLAGVMLVPDVPFRKMRLLALILAPLYFLAVNEYLNDFMLRPASLPAVARHIAWRVRNFLRWHLGENGVLAARSWADIPYVAALIAGWLRIRHRGPLCGRTGRKAGPQAGMPAPQFCAAGAISEGLQYALCGDANSFYDADKFCELGGLDSEYNTPAVQYLDLCYRAWQRGWPTVGVAAATFDPLDHLRFLARAVSSPKLFRRQWKLALKNLHGKALHNNAARSALWQAPGIALRSGPSVTCALSEELFLALTNGTVTVYAGRPPSGKPRILLASAYLPFPLSHGGAVRIHNLTTRAAAGWDQILVCFAETDAPPPPELLDRFVEIVLVRRVGSHSVTSSGRPEVVEQFASDAFRAALQLAVRKWNPGIAQLEFTQMAQYAADCAPARPILVEHDITFDLYRQLAHRQAEPGSDWDLQRELKLWRRFETTAWRDMACVVTMSAKDRALVTGTRSVALPNGVDLDRFRVAPRAPEPRRLLFVGSFSHLPNIMAVAFFLEKAWPRLREMVPEARLHIIAGANHEYFLDYQSRQVRLPQLALPCIEVEGFVSDVRPAYERAAVVIAPLIASAGTNLKILEAMACGRPIVSTPEGVNGLDLIPAVDFILVHNGPEMADAIAGLFASPEECRRLALAGRRRVEESYGWHAIAQRQDELYRELTRR